MLFVWVRTVFFDMTSSSATYGTSRPRARRSRTSASRRDRRNARQQPRSCSHGIAYSSDYRSQLLSRSGFHATRLPPMRRHHRYRQRVHRHQCHHGQLRQPNASTRAHEQAHDGTRQRACIHDAGEGAVHEHGSERLVARRPSARHYHERRRDRKHQEHEGVHHLAKRSLKKRQQQKRRRRKRKQNLIQTHERNALVQEPPSCQQRDRSGKQPDHVAFIRLPYRPPPEAEPTRTIPTMNAEKATQSKGRHNSETASRHRSRR